MFIKQTKPVSPGAGRPDAGAAGAAPVHDADVVEAPSVTITESAPPRKGLGAFVSDKPRAQPAAPKKTEGGLFGRFKAGAPKNESSGPKPAKGLFASKKASAPADSVTDAQEVQGERKSMSLPAASESKKSLLGSLKASKPAASKADKPAKAAKPARASKAPSSKSVAVLVELEDGKQVCWDVTAQGMTSIEMEQAPRVLSFSVRDQRFGTDVPLSVTAAQSLALAEIGEDVRLINASRNLRAVYATTAERSKSFGLVNVGPGLMALEPLFKAADTEQNEADRIYGLQLFDSDGSMGLVVLYHFNAQGDASPPQVTVNPTDLSFVLAQFVASRRLDPDTTKVVLVKNQDLLKSLAHFKPYPNQASILGMPVSKVLNAAAMLSLVAAVGAGGYAGYGFVLKQNAERDLARASQAKQQAYHEADALLTASVVSFANTQAIDVDATMAQAQQVWVPGAVVSLDATSTLRTFGVRMPMTRGSNIGGRPSMLDRTTANQVDALINITAPEGCSKSILNLSGALNAAQVTVECESSFGRLSAYRLD